MEEHIEAFLKHCVWRRLVLRLGPTLTIKLLMYFGCHKRKITKTTKIIFGCRPDAIGHQNFLPDLVYKYRRELLPEIAKKKA